MEKEHSLFLPLYGRSSIYGASLVASEFDDSNIVVWGPRGCTSQVLEAMNLQRQQFDYYHYPVSQADILTNGVDTLKKHLLPMVEGYISAGPLFLLLGDATLLTHEDIDRFIQGNISEEFPVIYVETGFKGDHYFGVNETLFQLVKRLCLREVPRQDKLINLIPEVGLNPQWRGDALEVKRLLERLGFQVNIIPNRSTIEDVAIMGGASHTLLMHPAIGRKVADYLKEQYGVPVIAPENLPLGLRGTGLWLNEIGEAFGVAPDIIEELKNEEEEQFWVRMRPGLREDNYNIRVDKIRSSRFVVCDDSHKSKQWSRMLLEEFNFAGGVIFPIKVLESQPESPGGQGGDNFCVLPEKNVKPLLQELEKDESTVILASDWLEAVVDAPIKDRLICVHNPMIKRISLVSKPYYGYQGLLHFLEDTLNCMNY